MQIKNYPAASVSQIKAMVGQGAKFVIFPYTISFVLMTLKKSSDIYFIKVGETTFQYSSKYVLMNLFIGWWGIPWGPIYTIGAIYQHIKGGKDVTHIVMSDLIQNDPEADTNTYNINKNQQNNQSTYNVPI